MRKILCILFVLLSINISAKNYSLKGTGKIGFKYVDIDNYLNKTSLDRKLTTNFNIISVGQLYDNNFVGYIKSDYNQKRESDKFDIESLRIELEKKKRIWILGEFYNKYSIYSLYNHKVEGISYKNDFDITGLDKKLTVNVFGGISNRKKDYTVTNTSPEYRQLMSGLSVELKYSDKDIIKISGITVYDNDSVNTGTVYNGPVKENVFAVNYEKLFFYDMIRMEFSAGLNKTDENYNDTAPEKDGNAYKFTTMLYPEKNMEIYIIKEYIDPEFFTQGNRTINSSKVGYKGYTLGTNLSFDKLSIEEEVELYKESFETDKTSHFKYYRSKLKYDLDKINKITLQHILKDSETDSQSVDKIKNTYRLSYNTKYKLYNFYANTNYSNTKDKLDSSNDIKNYGVSLSTNGRIMDNRLYNMWYFLWNKTEQSAGDSKFYLLTFNSNYKLVPRKIDLLGKSSYKFSKNTSSETKSFELELQLKYRISMEKVIDVLIKKDKTTGGSSPYDANIVEMNYTVLF